MNDEIQYPELPEIEEVDIDGELEDDEDVGDVDFDEEL